MSILNYIFKNKDLPRWIVFLNYGCLGGIVVWPLVFFGSIFMFDNPRNIHNTYIQVILLDSYPLLLMGLTFLSFKIFQWSRLISMMLPSLVILAYLYLFFTYLLPGMG
jgi:hypothetical protein